MERFNEVSKKKGIIQFFCKEKGITEDEYKQNQSADPEDYPRWKNGMCSTAVLNLDEVEAEFEEVQELVKQCEDRAGNAGDADEQEAAFTGIVFVVFEKPSDCYKVAYAQSGFLMRTFKSIFFFCYDKEDFYKWERAPEPTDVYWENLGVGYCARIVRMTLSNFFTLILVLVCFGAVSILKVL